MKEKTITLFNQSNYYDYFDPVRPIFKLNRLDYEGILVFKLSA